MRPVNRGSCPTDDEGDEVRFAEYTHARKKLIQRLGEYCSYCEMHLDSSLAVEHVRPKKPPGAGAVMLDRALDWHNFLLACTNCNSTKGDTDVVLGEYLWPDRDDTFHALRYSVGGVVDSAPGGEKIRADRLLDLVGLRKLLDTQEASDRRWLNRKDAWEAAVRSKGNLAKCPHDAMRDQIILTVVANGYWSIWMTVFADDPDMRGRLLQAFPGTQTDHFNL